MINTIRTFLYLSVLVCRLSYGQSLDLPSTTSLLQQDKNFTDVSKLDVVQLDVRYATTNNFLKQNVYGDFNTCFLHNKAAEKLKVAAQELKTKYPGWKFLIFDCLRPLSIQKTMWAKVKGTDQQRYVANPNKGSLHNFGFAIDLSLMDDKGQEVDMGTPFDFFGPLAEPVLENKFLKSGNLTSKQLAHRKILRTIMESAQFTQLPLEWWHFDALNKNIVRKKYKLME